jgi:ABC-type Na+ transport system ATPase subunit NatA
MVQDDALKSAVAAIAQRSERQPDLQKLVGAFVDVGILPQIENANNQIIYGRRGTGKTHVLRVLGSHLEARGSAVAYIDARNLGSTTQFSDQTVPFSTRCTSLFRDILGEINNALLDHVIEKMSDKEANFALEALNVFQKAVTEPFTTLAMERAENRNQETISTHSAVDASLAIAPSPKAAVHVGTAETTGLQIERTTTYSARTEDKIVFPAISSSLKSVLSQSKSQLFILIDEWSSLPTDVQPFLAEFFKRAFLPLAQVTVKIASLEHRSTFRIHGVGGLIGFELGSDIAAGIDIDDYYVFDRDPERITGAFGDMLVRHIKNELPDHYLSTTLGIRDGKELASKLFTERAVFQELVRASEGVARDLINIFITGYFGAHRKGREKIERAMVLDAARQWFEQDKEGNLDDSLREVLRKIIDEVIGKRKARSFLLPRELGDHPAVQKLFDLRVLHLVQRGYADKDRPGVRYNIYSLDYGTYVDLLNTSKKPQDGKVPTDQESSEDFIVPFDDKRSIRRIILTKDILGDYPARPAERS